jgi:hypothetical protein
MHRPIGAAIKECQGGLVWIPESCRVGWAGSIIPPFVSSNHFLVRFFQRVKKSPRLTFPCCRMWQCGLCLYVIRGKPRQAAFFCTNLLATPAHILEWVIRRWPVGVILEEARTILGVETQPLRSDQAVARITPILSARFVLVTVMDLQPARRGRCPCRWPRGIPQWSRQSQTVWLGFLAISRCFVPGCGGLD